MIRNADTPRPLTKPLARRIWLSAQKLDVALPFGEGPDATRLAIEHLGYVQIDTINVIERCHHHILWSRIPGYERQQLHRAQSIDKSVFEYWTHALAYVPSNALPVFLPEMQRHRLAPKKWFQTVKPEDLRKVLARIRKDGPITIRDIGDDVLVEKDHPWASRKPSKRALQLAFYTGQVTISQRTGMLKSYDLMSRHFGWETKPRPASAKRVLDYLLDRAIRAQGFVSLDSVCYLDAKRKPAMLGLIERRVRRGELVPMTLEGAETIGHWVRPETLETAALAPEANLVHILSPFDPLVIQRRRLQQIFDYEHRFEAYVPREKRVFGYFALPVLVGDAIVAAIDLKADRDQRRLGVQQWTWINGHASKRLERRIEEALDAFERFQLA